MKQVPITPAGAMILDSRHKIPEIAKASLDKFANNRFKELKFVTKAFKFQFPFYEGTQKNRSFNKIFQILDQVLQKRIPYLETAKVKFLSQDRDSSENIWIRLGPFELFPGSLTEKQAKAIDRYIRKLNRSLMREGLPLSLSIQIKSYTKPTKHRYAYYATEEERRSNTYNVMEIRIVFRGGSGENGYLLLFFAPQILKVLETLHRFAHYADTTFRVLR